MKLFLSGPITGDPGYKRKFQKAAEHYRLRGYTVVSPAVLPPGLRHEEYLHICKAMVDICDGIALLPGWEESPGARIEETYARKKNKKIFVR